MNDVGQGGLCKDIDVVMIGPKSFPPLIGGIETHVYEVSRRLASRGANVSVIVPRSAFTRTTDCIEKVEVRHVFNIRSKYTLKLSMMPWAATEIRRTSGIVHAHDATGGFVAAKVKGKRGFIYTMHGMGFHPGDWPPPFRQGIRLLERTALRNAQHVFCTDERSGEYAASQREQVEILPNGVDLKAFAGESGRPAQYDEDRFVFLFVGRLARVKGVSVLLEAISRIPETERKKAQFVFVGDGPSRGELLAAGRTIPQIRMLGAIPHSDIVPYFVHADAFLLPSLSEGLPISLLEAMAASLPCVASNVGGISSQFPSDALRFVPPGDADSLVKEIAALMSDRRASRALGQRGRDAVAERFSWERIVDRLVEVYRATQNSTPSR